MSSLDVYQGGIYGFFLGMVVYAYILVVILIDCLSCFSCQPRRELAQEEEHKHFLYVDLYILPLLFIYFFLH